MVDIPVNVKVRVNVDQQAIRQISRQVTDAVRGAALNLNVDSENLRRQISQIISGVGVSLSVDVTDTSISQAKTKIETGLRNISVSPSVSTASVREITSTVKEAIEKAAVEAQPTVPNVRAGGFISATPRTQRASRGLQDQFAVEETGEVFDQLRQSATRLSQGFRAFTVEETGEVIGALNISSRDLKASLDSTKAVAGLLPGEISKLSSSIGGVTQPLDAVQADAQNLNQGISQASNVLNIIVRELDNLSNEAGGAGGALNNLETAASSSANKLRNSDEEISQLINTFTLDREATTQFVDATRARIRVAREQTRFGRSLIEEQISLENTIQELRTRLSLFGDTTGQGQQALNQLENELSELQRQIRAGFVGALPQATLRERGAPVGFGRQQDFEVLEGEVGQVVDSFDAVRQANAQVVNAALEAVRAEQNLTPSLEARRRAEDALVASLQPLQTVESALVQNTASAAAARLGAVREENRVQRTEEALEQANRDLVAARSRAIVALRGGPSAVGGGAGIPGGGLDINQQARFVEVLERQGVSARTAAASLKAHNGTIGRGSALVSDLNRQLSVSAKAAIEFGRAASSAAQRFLAWASPATFIFRALQILRDATDQIVSLDTQARRLAFFDRDFFKSTGDAAADFANQIGVIAESQRTIIETSRTTGISLNDVSEAFIETARVGRDTEPEFAAAVRQLVLIEGGALSTGDAVRFLNSILQQFNLTGEDAALVAAQLFEASRESSFGVSQLGNAVTRIASAFSGFQNLRFDEVVRVVGVAASRTGADIGRLSTALRQFSTLAVQNVDRIRELTDIDIATEGGELAGFDPLLELLEFIGERRGTQQAEELIKLLADRRNLADINNLAGAAGRIREELAEIDTESEATAAAAQAVINAFSAESTATAGLERRIEALNTELVKLVRESGVQEFLADVVLGANRFVRSLQGLLGVVQTIAPALTALAAVRIGVFATRFAQGFLGGTLGTQLQEQARQRVALALQEGQAQSAIVAALDAQILSKEKATGLSQQNVLLVERQVQLESRVVQLVATLDAEQRQVLNGQRALNTLTEQQRVGVQRVQAAQRAVTQNLAEQRNLQVQISNQVAEQVALQSTLGARIGRAVRGLGTTIGAVALPLIGDFAANQITAANEAAREELRSIDVEREILGGVVRGGALGATIGSFILPGVGTAIGAGIGAIGGGIASGISATGENEEIAEQAQKRREEEDAAVRAIERQRLQIEEQARVRRDASRDQLQAAQDLLIVEDEIRRIELRINEIGSQRAEQLGLLDVISQRNIDRIRLQERLSRRQLEITNERVRLEEDIEQIRARGSRISQILETVERARLQVAEQTGNIIETGEIRIEFSRQQIRNQAATIQDELDRTAIEIGRITGEQGREQELRRLSRQRVRLQEELNDLQLDSIRQEFDARVQILDISRRESERQITAWRESASAITDAFSDILGAQQGISDSIRQETSFLVDALSAQANIIEDALSGTGLTGARLQQRIAREQVSIIERQLTAVRQSTARQLAVISDVPISSLDELEERSIDLIDAFGEARSAADALGSGIDENVRLQLAIAETSLNSIQQEIDARSNRIQQLVDIQQREIEATRNLIQAKRDELSAIQERIQEEAEIGRRFLETPEQIVQELRSVLTAQEFLSGLQGDREAVVSALERRINELQSAGGGGRAALQTILQGLNAAQSFNIRLVRNLTPERLTQAFSRLQLFSSEDVNALLSEEDQTRTEIQSLQESIVSEFIQLQELQKENTEVANLIAENVGRLAAEESDRETELRNQATRAINNTVNALEEVNRVAAAIETLGPQLAAIIDSFRVDDIVNITGQVEDRVREVRDLISAQQQLDPVFQGERARLSQILSEITSLRTGDLRSENISDELRRQLDPSFGARNQDELFRLNPRLAELSAQISILRSQFETGLGVTGDSGAILKGIQDLEAEFTSTLAESRRGLISQRIIELIEQIRRSPIRGEFEDIVNSLVSEDPRISGIIAATEAVTSSFERATEAARSTAELRENINTNTEAAQDLFQRITDFISTSERVADSVEQQTSAIVSSQNQSGQVELSPGAVEAVGQGIQSATQEQFDRLTTRIASLEEALARSRAVDLNVGEIEISINAEIVEQIQDDGFAAALREEFAGTALEGQIDVIQAAVIDIIRQLRGNALQPTEPLNEVTGE